MFLRKTGDVLAQNRDWLCGTIDILLGAKAA